MNIFTRIWDYIKLVLTNLTVEPVVFAFSFSYGLYSIVSAELYIQKVCKVNLAYGDEICDSIQTHKEEQVAVQQYVSTLKIWNTILQCIPGIIFTLFAGPWSDKHGRKFLIVASLFGFIFNNAVFMICTHWFYELKAEYLLLEALQDCTGGYSTFFMAVYAYITDITPPEHRTKRMAFLAGLWPIGNNIGKALCTVIKNNLGFMFNFAFGMLVAVLAMVYTAIFVKDSLIKRNKRLEKIIEKEGKGALTEKELALLEPKTKVGFGRKIKDFFDLRSLLKAFKSVFRQRPHGMRKFVLLVIFCYEMEFFINVGDWGNSYLYYRRRLEWTMGDFSQYVTIVGFVGIFSQYAIIPVLSEKLKVPDPVISMMDMATCIIQTIIIIFANKTWMVYLAACIAILDSSSYAIFRCMLTKLVDADEVGQVLAALSATMAFLPLVATPIFATIYKKTVETLPQTHYIILACLFAINLCVLIYVHLGLKKKQKKIGKGEENEEEEQKKKQLLAAADF